MREELDLGRLMWWALEIEAEARRLRVWIGSEDGCLANGERGSVSLDENARRKREKREMRERRGLGVAMGFVNSE